ncbi:cyclin-G2-like isoform 5-T5 [Salvelinus alpinus]
MCTDSSCSKRLARTTNWRALFCSINLTYCRQLHGAGMQDLQDLDNETCWLVKELKSYIAQEADFLPRETGLNIMESAAENHNGVSAKCRNAKVEDLWSLTSFFGFSTQTFVLAVNLLDRFLAIMKVQPKHLPCIGVSCLHIAAKMVEDECNISPTHELIRISQSKFTVSDVSRMEKIISEKLNLELKAITALTFLYLYHAVIVSLTSESHRCWHCLSLLRNLMPSSLLPCWKLSKNSKGT